MTLRDNIMAILESCFSGYKEELIINATNRIIAQVERQKPEKIFIEGIEYRRADALQTERINEEDKPKCHKPQSAYYRCFCEEKEEQSYCDGCEFWYAESQVL